MNATCHPNRQARTRGLCSSCYQMSLRSPEQERIRQILKKYNLTIDSYMTLVDKANGYCMLCGLEGNSLVVDHDHRTGIVRGLIHRQCNVLLGMAADNVWLLEAAITYLKKEH